MAGGRSEKKSVIQKYKKQCRGKLNYISKKKRNGNGLTRKPQKTITPVNAPFCYLR